MRIFTHEEERILDNFNARCRESRHIKHDNENHEPTPHRERKKRSDAKLERMIAKFDDKTEFSSDIRTVLLGATYSDIRRFRHAIKNRLNAENKQAA